jgi:hypothetical protein
MMTIEERGHGWALMKDGRLYAGPFPTRERAETLLYKLRAAFPGGFR